MRLVFILYAEERDLIPSMTDARARALYAQGYSVRGLYAKLAEDEARYPDTMDERVGAWGWLLALFRLVHRGHPSGWIKGRGGKLFDPDAFSFLEGRGATADPPRVLPVSDGTILRILRGLMVVDGERISYRTLDVQEIGSVYETVMGFTVETAVGRALAIRAGKNNRTPVFVDLDALAAAKGKDRIKFLKEEANRGQLSASVAKAVEQARTADDLAAALDPIVDERGSPMRRAVPAGTPILQPTDERRRTGSHYTPRSLTEPIVRHALEPAFERLGPDATPEAVLSLKVCDPAMGSGAFLVEACRALAARLVQAWERHKDKKPAIPPDEDEELHARRLVAQRCLYGVDKNPLATDLTRLSLWLATLARDHEFTFLDHALKSGDSLVGLSLDQIKATHWDASKPPTLVGKLVSDHLRDAEQGRNEIRERAEFEDEKALRGLLRGVEAKTEVARLIGDAAVAAFFAEAKPKRRIERLVTLQKDIQSHLGRTTWTDVIEPYRASLRQAPPLRPFHWDIEFPEVFSRKNDGFDAIVGNPPFAGKNTTIASNRDGYLDWLKTLHDGAHGNADVVAHFFRRAFGLLRDGGCFGLIATNTIGQGDTRATGLAAILKQGGAITHTTRRLKWPGEAAVVVSVVHVKRGVVAKPILDHRPVRRISAYLVEGDLDTSPMPLAANVRKAFEGSKVLGMGFTFDDEAAAKGTSSSIEEMRRLIAKDQRNGERIFPYVGGEEVNSDPNHAHRRFIIDFGEMGESEARTGWPNLFEIVERLVKPQRAEDNRAVYRQYWWRYAERRARLYPAINGLEHCLVTARHAPHFSIARLIAQSIFADSLDVFAFDGCGPFACLQGRVHELWARSFGSSIKDDLRYTPSECFAPFPFPPGFESDPELEAAGQAYHDHRAGLMVARNEGMTKTYNRFHDRGETAADIVRLRELHAAMDRAVLAAYGWPDLAERAAPVFLDESNEDDHTYQGRLFWPSPFRDEVLSRLLALNASRHAEEVRLSIAPGMKGKAAEEDEEEGE
jgi:hypothetical protein